ncbi:Chromatin-remodeling complex subunit ies6 [Golovinomyces cichoracearum]|uniref:Chromatin-remodeling complex subunit ies6 n=1 Tax=Golovinomyces cichoracearum TaxID=62708 RepID=A0A420JB64_9PEZI|nr:Chromatin-remodeling complex subunit ies6 [Golovinomyces cichoracearum]
MAPSIEEADAHYALLNRLDINSLPKPFRNPNWRPNQRRNKNVKYILGEAVRKEASLAATQVSIEKNALAANETDTTDLQQAKIPQVSKGLARLVLEKNSKHNISSSAPSLTYSNIESAISLAHPKHYCDITGLPAPYTDPKTRLRYHNKEVFGVIRSLGPGVAEQYLEARGAHTILK